MNKITETTTSYTDAELVTSTFSPVLDPADLQMASPTKGKLALPGSIHFSIHLFNTYPVPTVCQLTWQAQELVGKHWDRDRPLYCQHQRNSS